MAKPRYEVRDVAGIAMAGADVADDQLKFEAARYNGKIIDTRTGATVYDATPGSGLDSTIL
ncbi:hypothetical protein SEA_DICKRICHARDS_63 [Microbacterium phage DickRichards]|uniref:hypothetical protein n=1 Tax=Microbacterium phage DickRichards TaxID=2776866 RepID=UPI0018A67935|nr:hypothetical protein QDW35_gp63 [Microbacterium phage DickRichards]QOP66380.1 hypothetical protein SEA_DICKRICHARDS_63 [Microbacterium phage DickRichards]